MIAITVAVLLLNLVTLSCAQETSISGVKTALYDAKVCPFPGLHVIIRL